MAKLDKLIQDLDAYRVKPMRRFKLAAIDSHVDGGMDKDQAVAGLTACREKLAKLQVKLYAQGTQALLVVFQAMDTAGKDSTIREVFTGINPQGVNVHGFKGPSSIELSHDYLWRIHAHTPERGKIGVFNRSHYEDVLIARVKELVPAAVWRRRYDHINAFEALLHDEGTRIVKFYLHISKDYQKERLQRRLDDPEKHWKFDPNDLVERARWDSYMKAYEEAMMRCSTEVAPWYIVPAETRWFRDLLVAQVLVKMLESMKPAPPKAKFDPSTIVIE